MKATATVRMRFPSEKNLETVIRSLEPEVTGQVSMRSKASMAKEGDCLILKIEAKDTAALRAALNAYLRWINSMLTVFEILEKKQVEAQS